MGRQRKHPTPSFLTVVADTPDDAEGRSLIVHRLAKPTGGRSVRVDRLREAMMIADRVPATPKDRWRRTRGKPGKKITPMRESNAAAMLMNVCADRGDILTIENATRIIEQARTIIDQARGISEQSRNVIEEAREIVAWVCRTSNLPSRLTKREREIVEQAKGILQQVNALRDLDRDLCRQIETLMTGAPVHYSPVGN